MNEQFATWLLAIAGWLSLLAGLVVSYVALVQRITRLETFFEVLGKKAANILHSPHTPELDFFIEKYVTDKMMLTTGSI